MGARDDETTGDSGRWTRLGPLSLLLLLLPSCTNACARAPGEPLPVAPPLSASEPLKTSSGLEERLTPPPTTRAYADAIRLHDFPLAARLLDAAPAEERARPEVRYARARVAIALGDEETALRVLDKLEEDFPLFTGEAQRARLDAARASRDLTLLTLFLGQSASAQDRLVLAEAAERHGDTRKALEEVESALRALDKSKKRPSDELARAHALRARLFEANARKAEAIQDYLWLSTQAPASDAALDAPEASARLGRPLTHAERAARARAFADAGLVAATEKELNLLEKAPGAKAKVNPAGLRAWARYLARDYEAAAPLFRSASQAFDDKSVEYLYYEARALSRAHRDDEAIEKYRVLSRGKGPFAEHSAFQVAHLAFLQGRWTEAVQAFDKYRLSYGKAAIHGRAVARELPLARLAQGDAGRAEKELGALFDQEKDSLEKARLLELLASANERAGSRDLAVARYRAVIDERPLSLPALLAAARLRALNEAPPPPLSPARAAALAPPLEVPLPDKVARLHAVGLDDDAEEALRAEEKSFHTRYGARSGEALCVAYGELSCAKRRYQIAQTATSWAVLREEPTPASRWQSECVYPRPYEDIVTRQSSDFGVPDAFVYGVMRQESAFRPTVVSPARAVGLMQIIPPTAERIALELAVPYEPSLLRAPAVNIRFGSFYLKKLLDTFAGRFELAAAAYNAGPRAVSRWLATGEELPLDLFLARIPYDETRTYVARVLGNAARYAYLAHGPAALPELELEIPRGLRAPDDAY